ncbi:hypothetical protein [Parapedobacter tibetensis]|uniref:hypothetical protein n=1 Tax=Parapedobacter tibetensis TaxID=2972951 RepID=UPI00214D24D2|nr:hypothetical protein [Parapedobacter tibetensis]
MAKKKCILTVLLVVSSFLLGFSPEFSVYILSIEIGIIRSFPNPNNSAIFHLQFFLLIIAHLGVIALLFLQCSPKYFDTFLAYFPPLLVVSYVWIAIIAVVFYPILWLSIVVFITIWLVLLIMDKKGD